MPRDAERLARWELAGSPRPVWVPDEETEGLRDLCHAIEDRRRDRTTAYLRVQGLLCRHDKIWNQRTKGGKLKTTWTKDYFAWLDSDRAAEPGRPGGAQVRDRRRAQRQGALRRARRQGPEGRRRVRLRRGY